MMARGATCAPHEHASTRRCAPDATRALTDPAVRTQVAGALLTAFVIKFAGNVLKTFATVLALLCTCAVSMVLFDFTPTPLFGLGVGATAGSIWLYARPSLLANRAAAAERGGEAGIPLIQTRR